LLGILELLTVEAASRGKRNSRSRVTRRST
jgi:hypothetical protein